MTTFVNDTFTGGGSTQLDAHVGETGATWVTSSYRGTGVASALVVTGGKLQRTASGSGTIWAYPSGVISGEVAIEFPITFDSAAGYGSLEIADTIGGDVGDGSIICTIDSTGIYLTGGADTSPAFTDGIEAIVRLEFNGTAWRVLVDSVETDTAIAAGTPGFPFLFGMYDNSATPTVQLNSLLIESSSGTPPAASDFWTSFVGSHEVP